MNSLQPTALSSYSMPAEWEPHEATWISWPHQRGQSFPDSYNAVIPTFVAMAAAIGASEILRVNVRDQHQEKEVKKLLSPVVAPEHLEFHCIKTNEPWCRDHGAIFVRHRESHELAVIDCGYNAWGGKYPPFDADNKVPSTIADILHLPSFQPGIILEGGSIDVNGAGSLLTTESCLLNPNRNPTFSRSDLEKVLKNSFGVSQILWLGDGIEGDDTDGHIDDITRFVAEDCVVTVMENNQDDPNHLPLKENRQRLENMSLDNRVPSKLAYADEVQDVSGAQNHSVHEVLADSSTGATKQFTAEVEFRKKSSRSLKIIELPMPPRIEREGQRLPASHANFYITNHSVLLPAFGGASDDVAQGILATLFPTRKIIPIDCRELIWGLGAFHCLTQQQPMASL